MSEVVVTTRSGQVRGVRTLDVVACRGIPFAAPPVGRSRFKPPQSAEPWEGVRDALVFGATAPKAPYPAPVDQVIPEVDIPGDG